MGYATEKEVECNNCKRIIRRNESQYDSSQGRICVDCYKAKQPRQTTTIKESKASWWDIHIRGNPQERETAIEELCEHLRQMRLNATVGSKERNIMASLWKMNLGFLPIRVIDSVKVANKNLDTVELEWRVRNFGSDEYGGFENMYRCNYVVQTIIGGSESELMSKGKPIRKSFLSRKVIDFKWEGKELAQILNNDANLRDTLHSIKPIYSLETKPDIEHQCIRILPDWNIQNAHPVSAFPTVEAFEAYDRIAQHIRSIANVRP